VLDYAGPNLTSSQRDRRARPAKLDPDRGVAHHTTERAHSGPDHDRPAAGSQLDGLSSLTSIPVANLLLILIGMPLLATGLGWLVAGRDPGGMSRQPLD
jgi:hypothetical protein